MVWTGGRSLAPSRTVLCARRRVPSLTFVLPFLCNHAYDALYHYTPTPPFLPTHPTITCCLRWYCVPHALPYTSHAHTPPRRTAPTGLAGTSIVAYLALPRQCAWFCLPACPFSATLCPVMCMCMYKPPPWFGGPGFRRCPLSSSLCPSLILLALCCSSHPILVVALYLTALCYLGWTNLNDLQWHSQHCLPAFRFLLVLTCLFIGTVA